MDEARLWLEEENVPFSLVSVYVEDVVDEHDAHQVRFDLDQERVALIREAYSQGKTLPPLVVRLTRHGNYRIVDGWHRFRAMTALDANEFKAYAIEVDDETYRRLQAEANLTHGLPTTMAERCASAEYLINLGVYKSAQEAGKELGINHHTLMKYIRAQRVNARAMELGIIFPASIAIDARDRLGTLDDEGFFVVAPLVAEYHLSTKQTAELCELGQNLTGEALEHACTALLIEWNDARQLGKHRGRGRQGKLKTTRTNQTLLTYVGGIRKTSEVEMKRQSATWSDERRARFIEDIGLVRAQLSLWEPFLKGEA